LAKAFTGERGAHRAVPLFTIFALPGFFGIARNLRIARVRYGCERVNLGHARGLQGRVSPFVFSTPLFWRHGRAEGRRVRADFPLARGRFPPVRGNRSLVRSDHSPVCGEGPPVRGGVPLVRGDRPPVCGEGRHGRGNG
jgi:hypothetical protein